MPQRKRIFLKAVHLPLSLLAMAAAIFRRKPDAWEYEQIEEKVAVETPPPHRSPRVVETTKRYALAAGFSMPFFAGAAFTAGAGDQMVRLMDEDAAALEAASWLTGSPESGTAPDPESIAPAPARKQAPAEAAPAESAPAEATPRGDPPPRLHRLRPPGPNRLTLSPNQGTRRQRPKLLHRPTRRWLPNPPTRPPQPLPRPLRVARSRPHRPARLLLPRKRRRPSEPRRLRRARPRSGSSSVLPLRRRRPLRSRSSVVASRRSGSTAHCRIRHRLLPACTAPSRSGSSPARRATAPAGPPSSASSGRRASEVPPPRRPGARAPAARMAGTDAWKGALALSGRTGFADRAAAFADLYRFVGIEAPVNGYADSKVKLRRRVLQPRGS